MSLNTVVNNLVRAAAGIPADISDDDLDRHVASLLAQEAKERESKWSEMGLSAFLDRESTDAALPRPNKRFLASVIRTVDGHNAALLREQAHAARSARLGRGESSRTGASRLFGGALQGMSRDSGRTRDRDRRTGDKRSEDKRTEVNLREREEHEPGSRDRQDGLTRGRSYGEDATRSERDERDRHRRPSRYQEDEERSSARREDRHQSRRHHDDDPPNRAHRSSQKTTTSSDRPTPPPSSPPPRKKHSLLASPPAPPAGDSPPPPARSPISKMDKYFSTSYDPRLDLGEIPKEGMIAAVGWDNMLAVLKERGQKRRHMSPALDDDLPHIPKTALIRSPSPDPAKRKKREERRKRRGDSDSEDERERAKRKEKRRKEKQRDKHLSSGGGGGGTAGGLLDGYEYVRKGGTREWDVGK